MLNAYKRRELVPFSSQCFASDTKRGLKALARDPQHTPTTGVGQRDPLVYAQAIQKGALGRASQKLILSRGAKNIVWKLVGLFFVG